jgi:hypothetical protein
MGHLEVPIVAAADEAEMRRISYCSWKREEMRSNERDWANSIDCIEDSAGKILPLGANGEVVVGDGARNDSPDWKREVAKEQSMGRLDHKTAGFVGYRSCCRRCILADEQLHLMSHCPEAVR